jgi:hypothetical protein
MKRFAENSNDLLIKAILHSYGCIITNHFCDFKWYGDNTSHKKWNINGAIRNLHRIKELKQIHVTWDIQFFP